MKNELTIYVPTVNPEDGEIRREASTFEIPCDTADVSDGYHTFGELYEHRYLPQSAARL